MKRLTNTPFSKDNIIDYQYIQRPYSKPKLEKLGDIRSITLGGTPGAGESNNPAVAREPKITGDLPDDYFG